MFQIGDVLSVQYTGYKHYGIYAGDDLVIHNSKLFKKVVEVSLATFEDGKVIKVSSIKASDPALAIEKAKSYLNVPYALFSENCEHFVRTVCGLEKESTQLQKYLFSALGAGLVLNASNPTVKAIGGAAAIATLLTPAEESPAKNVVIASCLAAGLVFLLS